MPPLLTGNIGSGMDYAALSSVSYDYDYPGGLDLKPGSTFHQKLVSEVMNRARESRETVQLRHRSWRKIDETLTAFVPLDEEEKNIKNQDRRRPVSVVVPMSYAMLETLLTYLTSTFLKRPMFSYEGTGPEDITGASLLEAVVQHQVDKMKMGLQLHTLWRDGLAYGIGALAPIWTRETGRIHKTVERNFSEITGTPLFGTPRSSNREGIVYEGNRLESIDPYSFVPDPGVAIQDIQKAEFVGWVTRTNRIRVLEEETTSDGDVFNAKYLKHIDGRSFLSYDTSSEGRDFKRARDQDTRGLYGTRKPVDVLYMYVNLVPSEWKLSNRDKPEKWLFAVAGDQIVIQAKPLNMEHNMFPVVVCSPDYDGYTVSPISRLEVLYGLQTTMDWFFSSHTHNVRKGINDMLIVDPSMINMADLQSPKPGKLVRLRRPGWGRGVQNAVHQLQVNDITRNNIADSVYISEIMKSVSGAQDAVQGVYRSGSERRSATEARGVQVAALSRLEKAAIIISMMSMHDLGYMLAANTQQLMKEETYVRMTGRYAEELAQDKRLQKVSPRDLDINFDVSVFDNTQAAGNAMLDSWVQIFQIAATNPEVAAQFDMVRVFKHIARLMGARDVGDFIKQGGSIQPQVLPDQEVAQQYQQGNLVPVEALRGASVS